MKQEKVEKYSIRKFKVGVGSALIGLSFLGATGLVNDVPIVGNLMGIEHVSADENNASNKISFEELSKTGDEPDLNKKQETYHFVYHKHDKDGTENIYNESGGSVNGVHNDGTAPNGSDYLYRISADPNNQSLSGLPLEDNFYNYDNQEYRLKYPEINYRSINGLYKSPSDGKYYVYEDSYLNTADHDSEGKPLYHVDLNEVDRLKDGYGIEKEEITKSEKKYVKDGTRDKGQPDIIEKGKDGVVKVTTLYKSTIPEGGTSEDAVFGKDVVRKTITEMKPTIVKVAAKDKVVTTPIPSPKKYVKDDTRKKGSPDLETKGVDGSKTVTTTYQVNRNTGEVTGTDGTPVIVNPTETVIKVAAKDKVVVKELPSRVRYVGDENKENSTDPVRTEGKKGKEVTTTTYAVDPKTGTISESTKTERTEEPTDTVVTIGTKPKVELIKDGNRTIERTTRYKVNEDTGEVVTTTTDKLIPNKVESSNGDGELPPVVDVPEFDLNKLPKEVKEEPKQEVPNVGTGLNTFNDGRKKPAQATEIVPVASTKEEPKAETPKDVSTPVTLEQKNDEQGKQAPVQTASSKKEMKELPNTGTASNAALTLAGVTFAMFGTVMLAKKKD